MALTVTVTKKSVSYVMDKMWHVTLNMSLKDDLVEVLNRDYSVRYRTGDSVTEKVTKFIDLMQDDINKYKLEQQIYTAAALDTAVTSVQNGLLI